MRTQNVPSRVAARGLISNLIIADLEEIFMYNLKILQLFIRIFVKLLNHIFRVVGHVLAQVHSLGSNKFIIPF